MMEEFKRLQKAAGFTGRGVAEFLGIDYATVKRYRNGDLEVPKLVIMALSYCAKYGPDYALEGDKEPSKEKLTEQQKDQLRALMATKTGKLRRNIGYAPIVLEGLLNCEKVGPTHTGMDFPPVFYSVIEALNLKPEVKEGSLDEWLKMTSRDYRIALDESPFTFKEMLDECGITYEYFYDDWNVRSAI